ncbi:MAG: hypothetical protein KAG10_09950 [Methylococcales bacterium]|nr:hypothetical protein [Methylococcales bacterium]MCK5926205.1 hypothetical protein [Methylococcales bacterium]
MKYTLLVIILFSTSLSAEPSNNTKPNTSKQACAELSQSLTRNTAVESFCKLEPKLSEKINFMYKKVCNQVLTETEIKQSADAVMLELTETYKTMGEGAFCKKFVSDYDVLLEISSRPSQKK